MRLATESAQVLVRGRMSLTQFCAALQPSRKVGIWMIEVGSPIGGKDQHVVLGVAADRRQIARVGGVEVPHHRPAPQHDGVEAAGRHLLPHRGIAPVAFGQREARKLERGTHEVSLRWYRGDRAPYRFRTQAASFHLLQCREIVRDAAFQIEFRLVAQLVARARDVVDAGCRIGEAVEVQAAADLHLRIRDVLLDDALEVAQRDADAGADVVDAALHLVGNGGEIDAERRVLVVDEVVLVIAALLELERQAMRGIFDDAAHHRHRAVPRGLARPVGRGKAQRHRLDAHVVVVIGADVLAHELGRVVDALRLGRQVLGHRLPGR